MFHIYHW